MKLVGATLALSAVVCVSLPASEDRGLCSMDSSVPGLPTATCYFPSCPTGADCMPPTIEKSSASIEYFEPMIRWQDRCTNTTITGSCWEVYIDFKFKLAARDLAGVSHIGVHLVTEVNARRNFKVYWGKTGPQDTQGRYEMTGNSIVHVPPGQRLEIGVFELCARDGANNEGCILPPKALNSLHLGR